MSTTEQAYMKFNADGKLLQVEYGLEAVQDSYQIVSIKCNDGIVSVSKKVPRPVLSVKEHTSVFKISDDIYMNITGTPADINYVVDRARTLAGQKCYDLGCKSLTANVFTRFLSEKFTSMIQLSGRRPPAFAAAIFGFNQEGPVLHYTDLSAIEYPCKACCAGEDRGKMQKFLEKNYSSSGLDEAIELALATLIESIGREAEAYEIEAHVLTKQGLTRLSEEAIGRVLQTIVEKL